MGNTLAQVKENIYKGINKSMKEIWPPIQIKEVLAEKQSEVAELLKFLNSKNMQDLEELEIEDTNEIILEVKMVLTKRNLIRHLEEKFQVMYTGVQRFFNKLEVL